MNRLAAALLLLLLLGCLGWMESNAAQADRHADQILRQHQVAARNFQMAGSHLAALVEGVR